MKLLIGEKLSVVTVVALGLFEYVVPTLGRLGRSGLIACLPLVPRSVAADDRALECRQCLHYVFSSRFAGKNLLELRAIALQSVYFRNDISFVIFSAHVAALPRSHRLFLERWTSAIPVKHLMVTDIPKCWTASRQLFVESSNCFWQSIG